MCDCRIVGHVLNVIKPVIHCFVCVIFSSKFDLPRDVAEPSSVQVEMAESMIKRLRFAYDPENFDNPVIQTHYKNLEAMALDEAEIEAVENHTSK